MDDGDSHRVIIDDVETGELRELLSGGFDVDPCPHCGHEARIAPTVCVVFREDALVLYVAGRAPDPVESVDWRSRLGPSAAPRLVQLPDLAALRTIVRDKLALRTAVLQSLLTAAAHGSTDAFLAEHWREFRPEVFTALELQFADECPCLPPFPLDPDQTVPAGHDLAPLAAPATATPDRRRLALGILQFRVLLALAEEWTRTVVDGHDVTSSLATDLEVYVAGASWPAGPDVLLYLLFDDELAGSSTPYVRHALRAAVTRSTGRPNPEAARWAETYFDHEAACGLGPGAPTAGMEAARVSADFARETIEYVAAWEAVTTRLHVSKAGGPDSRVPASGRSALCTAVDAAAVRAGHPRLVDAVLGGRH